MPYIEPEDLYHEDDYIGTKWISEEDVCDVCDDYDIEEEA